MGRKMTLTLCCLVFAVAFLEPSERTAGEEEAKPEKIYGLNDFPTKEKVEGKRFFAAMYAKRPRPAKDRPGTVEIAFDEIATMAEIRAGRTVHREKNGEVIIMKCVAYLSPEAAMEIGEGKHNVSATIVAVTERRQTIKPKDEKPRKLCFVTIELAHLTVRPVP